MVSHGDGAAELRSHVQGVLGGASVSRVWLQTHGVGANRREVQLQDCWTSARWLPAPLQTSSTSSSYMCWWCAPVWLTVD
jgi:hypothetical protein